MVRAVSDQQDQSGLSYVWLKRARPRSQAIIGVVGGVMIFTVSPAAMFVYGMGALVSMLFGFDPPIARVLFVQACAFIALLGVIEAAPYVLSRCPRCGHNPTRRKDGKFMTLRMRDAKLRKLIACEACGAED